MAELLELLGGGEAGVDEQEIAVKRSANYILWIILAFFVVFVLWATFTQIDRTVRGMGRVVSSSKLQVVSNLEGGVIEEILVKPGQTVKKGDILVRLSPTLSNAAFGSGAAEVDALRTKIARLNAEVRGAIPAYGGAGGAAACGRAIAACRPRGRTRWHHECRAGAGRTGAANGRGGAIGAGIRGVRRWRRQRKSSC